MSNVRPLSRLVMLGVGQVAWQVAKLTEQCDLIGTTRDEKKISALKAVGISPFLLQLENWQKQKDALLRLISGSQVLVSFPPDGIADQLFSVLCSEASCVIYISSTSVYGNYSGIVDESTPIDEQNPKSKLRLEAEKIWREQGAIVLRAPALYNSQSGLHIRLKAGSYMLPNDQKYISRIHIKDLSRIIWAAFAKPLPAGSTYLVGDHEPALQIDVVKWLCKEMNLPLPPIGVPDMIPPTLAVNRRVKADRILSELNLQLEFPSYKEGFMDCLHNDQD